MKPTNQGVSPLRQLAFMSFAGACLLLAAGQSFAQSGCTETSPAATGRATRLAGEAQVAQPQREGNTLSMMRAAQKTNGLAKAEVPVVCVPDFTGKTLDQAKAAIEKTRGLHFENAIPTNGGTVADQNPKPFHYVAIGTGVTLQLKPAEPVSHLRMVPDITRLDEPSLEAYLKRDGLTYGGSTNTETSDYQAGSIFQDPPAGKWVEENTPVFRYEAIAPPQQSSNYRLGLKASATELSINERVSLVALLTPTVGGAGYAFDFGDGMQGDMGSENTAAYQYPRDGTFTITVVARLPNGDTLEAKTVVQVHANSWTVVLQPNLRRANTNTPIVFETSFLPSSPAPERAQYWFYFDDDKKPVISKTPSVRRSFSDARTHWASVVVKDADGHSFKSNTAAVAIEKPIWPLTMASVAAIALLGFGGLKIAQRVATSRLKYEWVADVRGVWLVAAIPEGMLREGFAFTVIHPPPDISTRCTAQIVKRVEKPS
jgi:PKD domain/PASTA domain